MLETLSGRRLESCRSGGDMDPWAKAGIRSADRRYVREDLE